MICSIKRGQEISLCDSYLGGFIRDVWSNIKTLEVEYMKVSGWPFPLSSLYFNFLSIIHKSTLWLEYYLNSIIPQKLQSDKKGNKASMTLNKWHLVGLWNYVLVNWISLVFISYHSNTVQGSKTLKWALTLKLHSNLGGESLLCPLEYKVIALRILD